MKQITKFVSLSGVRIGGYFTISDLGAVVRAPTIPGFFYVNSLKAKNLTINKLKLS